MANDVPPVVELHIVGNEIDVAEEAPPAAIDGPPRDGTSKSKCTLPANCPVTALGHEGDVCFYLDVVRQLRSREPQQYSKSWILKLFGNEFQFLYDTWPRLDKDEEAIDWKQGKAAEALIAAAVAAGIWDPFKKVRGRGTWAGRDGELVYHTGDKVLVFPKDGGWNERKVLEAGLVGGYVYPAFERIAGPSPAKSPPEIGENVLSIFKNWNWRRGSIDARLLLGWIGAAMLGGALEWRPLTWITGGKGTGKSTLHKVLKDLFGEAVISCSDASAAGIWQELRETTLPVMLDEVEASNDNRQTEKVIRLARQAASGGEILRGGADHESSKFNARSCFLFSSINVLPLEPADLSRMAILEMGDLASGPPPNIKPAVLRELGEGLRRRLAEGWSRLPDVLQTYKSALEGEGMTARGGDQYGTLLACADLLLGDEHPCADTVSELAATVAPAAKGDWDADAGRDEFFMVNHLLSSMIIDQHGKRRTVGEWVQDAAGMSGGTIDRTAANRELSTVGLRVVKQDDVLFLAIAQKNKGLSDIFQGTHWLGKSSALAVWVQVARRLPQAENWPKNMSFGGSSSRAVLVPMAVIMPPLDDDGDEITAVAEEGAGGGEL